MLPEVVFGESLSIVGLIKGYINGINGFDDVVAETREVFGILEPALNDALSSGNIARDDPMMVTFEKIHTALVEYRRTIEKIERKIFISRYVKHKKYTNRLNAQLGIIKNVVPLLNISIAKNVKDLKQGQSMMRRQVSLTRNEMNTKLDAIMKHMEIKEETLDAKDIENATNEDLVKNKDQEEVLKEAQKLEKEGKYQKSLIKYLEYYTIMKAKGLEADDLNTAEMFYKLGEAHRKQDKLIEAKMFLEKCLFIRKMFLNEDDVLIGEVLVEIGWVYDKQGKYDTAIEQFEIAQKIFVKRNDKSNLGKCIHSMGVVYDRKGKYAKALEYYEKALEIKKKAFGEVSEEVAGTYNNMGNVYQSQGKYDQALEYYEKAIQIDLKTIGNNHPETKKHIRNKERCQEAKANR